MADSALLPRSSNNTQPTATARTRARSSTEPTEIFPVPVSRAPLHKAVSRHRPPTYSLLPALPALPASGVAILPRRHVSIRHEKSIDAIMQYSSPTRTSTSESVSHHRVPSATSDVSINSTPAPGSIRIPARRSSRHSLIGDSPKETSRKKSLGSVSEELRIREEAHEREWMTGKSPEGPKHKQKEGDTSPRWSKSEVNFSQMDKFSQSPPLRDDLVRGSSLNWTKEKENILKGPFNYLESHPGKDIRSQLIAAFNAWLDVPEESLNVIRRVVAMLHTASLLIDDVEDNSQLRRGIPVAHNVFGTAQTINSANYVYFCALKELAILNNPAVIQIYTEELVNLHRGQGMDLFWRDTLTCPSEDDYLEMVGNKTGGLFRLAIKLMCAESPSHNAHPDPFQRNDYVPLVNTIGLLFQILDDYKNLSDTIYTQNKGLCEDLTEGKFSFPIIHAIRADPGNLVLINILKQKTTDDEVKKYAVAYMDRAGSFSYTRKVLRGLTKKALTQVDEVDAGRGRGEQMKTILEKLRVDRNHQRGVSTPAAGGASIA